MSGHKEELTPIHEKLPYVVQSKDPHAHGERGEWMTRWDMGNHSVIIGKSNAYILLAQCKREMPQLKWRILKKNEADAYQQGIEVGKRLAAENQEKRKWHRPLLALPEHL